ncbi:helix-turn-helix domain-containing protein [Campylobacter concisus]|uniref:helix-turn-helix domain-containing protein n=1 Tax=Campylobacter concisus TaxID=199 RepID=UPI001E2DAF23|nr:helix-turn-helix transcriptional regulator [Campylobacter concisus]
MSKKYFIVKTDADQSIAQLVEDGFFEEWCQTPKKSMEMGDVVFLYDMNLTGEAKDKKWLPFKCVAELTDVGKETMSLRLLYEIDYTKLKFDKDEKVIVAKMQQGSDGVYELKEQGIISKLEEQNNENIVKRVCKELNITQRELAEIIKVNPGTPAQWVSKGEVPPTYQYLLELMLENKHLKEKIAKLTAFKELLNEI